MSHARPTARSNPAGAGVLLALLSASTFGTSGTFATALTDAGWSPGAAVAVRVGIAAVVLTVPALIQIQRLRRALGDAAGATLRRSAGMVAVYGLMAVAACQLCFFYAVQRLSVGVALMLEYLAVILVVLYMWIRHGQRPRTLTVVGAVVAIIGLVFVLDLTGGQHLDPIGVLWGLGAAVGLSVFYLISSRSEEALPPLAMAWAGMSVGAIVLIAAGVVGALPMHVRFATVQLGGRTASWIVPVLGLSLVAAALSYVAGINAARRLGAKVGSFIGLTEVLFAVLFAWLVLNQLPGVSQLVGGILIVAGVSLVRIDELRAPDDDRPVQVEPLTDEVPAPR